MTGISDSEQMEALPCRKGLTLATDLGLQKFRMATNCANVVKNIREDGMRSYWPDNSRNKCEDGDLQFGGYCT